MKPPQTMVYKWPGVAVISTDGEQQLAYGVGAVPEPATWALMLLGFAGLGFAGYRKAKAGQTAPPPPDPSPTR